MRRSAIGFSLLEVLIALAILGMSLGVLLQSQAQSLDATGRARDYNIASSLMRSKLVDIEAETLADGFVLGSTESEGDFAEDGFPDFTCAGFLMDAAAATWLETTFSYHSSWLAADLSLVACWRSTSTTSRAGTKYRSFVRRSRLGLPLNWNSSFKK